MMMISKKMWEFTVFRDHGCGLYDIVDFLDDLSNAIYDQWYIFFVLCRVHTRTGRVAYSFDAHGEPVNPLPPAIVVSPACGTLVNTAPTAAVPSACYSIPASSAAPPVPGYDSSSVAMAPYWQHQTNYYGRSGVAAPAYYSYWPLPEQHETTWVWKY